MGAKLWHSAQSMNDLKGIGKKYKGKLTIEGGWDSSEKTEEPVPYDSITSCFSFCTIKSV